MSGFWSSETILDRIRADRLVDPFSPKLVKHCAYELTMGPQALVTGDKRVLRDLEVGEQLQIPAGHFAQLMTEEVVRVPKDTLGLISMKSRVKSLGLVNVSGFHVDPGFKGRLRFSVYNAGPSPVVISRGTPTFLIWFAALDKATRDPYTGDGGRRAFSDRDTKDMLGDVHTPQVLADRVLRLERTISWRHQLGRLALAAVFGGFATFGFGTLASCDDSAASSSSESPSMPAGPDSHLPP
ncbi:dCTP deaminase [Candidatus Poriferisodalis sp.]|uniref:dCTP deaminase n=1 Tax=Candidatus Poriferisodalis sp. TaxID=3101277 RepID=UPI003B01D0C2